MEASPLSDTMLALVITSAVTVLVCLLEFMRLPWREARPKTPSQKIISSAGIKWLGTMVGLGLTLFAWWFSPEYHHKYFQPLYEAMPYVLPGVPVATALCLFFTEWRFGPAEDEGRPLGLLVLGRFRDVKLTEVRDELLSWVIKGFFLPINFVELSRSISTFRGRLDHITDMPLPDAHVLVLTLIYTLIIGAIIPGYFFSARLFGTQVKKIDHSWFGWLVTLACYAPLHSGVVQWIDYVAHRTDVKPWVAHTPNDSWLFYVIGGAIIFFELMHYWGEAQMGIRSSNLTNRGIVTVGPYRFCKHPVYVSKCFGWALIWMPFLASDTIVDDIRYSLLFLVTCWLFSMRAWVEERLLSTDPDFVAYALWVDKHGLFSWVGRIAPFMSFKWRLKRWEVIRTKGFPD